MRIKVENLFFSYQKSLILEEVDLRIDGGELIGIIGPNGGGKTTLLKLLIGSLKPDKGTISVNGKIGYVPQVRLTDQDFPISVFELVSLGALSKASFFGILPKEVLKKADLWIERLGLQKYKNTMFGKLSGGLAQRALLARALLSDPDILLLDEPTANIDPASSKMIFEILEELKETKTILLVTHDLKTVIEKVSTVLCVQKKITTLSPKDVCEHFAVGLYHPPLMEKKNVFSIF